MFDLLQYKIISSDAQILSKAPEASEGLENRLISMMPKSRTLEDLKQRVKSKRYTYTRISRMLMQILLGIETSTPASVYAHLLAFNSVGRELLAEYKHLDEDRIKIYSHISPEDCANNKDLATDVKADDIYSVICKRPIYDYSDYVCKPHQSNI